MGQELELHSHPASWASAQAPGQAFEPKPMRLGPWAPGTGSWFTAPSRALLGTPWTSWAPCTLESLFFLCGSYGPFPGQFAVSWGRDNIPHACVAIL